MDYFDEETAAFIPLQGAIVLLGDMGQLSIRIRYAEDSRPENELLLRRIFGEDPQQAAAISLPPSFASSGSGMDNEYYLGIPKVIDSSMLQLPPLSPNELRYYYSEDSDNLMYALPDGANILTLVVQDGPTLGEDCYIDIPFSVVPDFETVVSPAPAETLFLPAVLGEGFDDSIKDVNGPGAEVFANRIAVFSPDISLSAESFRRWAENRVREIGEAIQQPLVITGWVPEGGIAVAEQVNDLLDPSVALSLYGSSSDIAFDTKMEFDADETFRVAGEDLPRKFEKSERKLTPSPFAHPKLIDFRQAYQHIFSMQLAPVHRIVRERLLRNTTTGDATIAIIDTGFGTKSVDDMLPGIRWNGGEVIDERGWFDPLPYNTTYKTAIGAYFDSNVFGVDISRMRPFYLNRTPVMPRPPEFATVTGDPTLFADYGYLKGMNRGYVDGFLPRLADREGHGTSVTQFAAADGVGFASRQPNGFAPLGAAPFREVRLASVAWSLPKGGKLYPSMLEALGAMQGFAKESTFRNENVVLSLSMGFHCIFLDTVRVEGIGAIPSADTSMRKLCTRLSKLPDESSEAFLERSAPGQDRRRRRRECASGRCGRRF